MNLKATKRGLLHTDDFREDENGILYFCGKATSLMEPAVSIFYPLPDKPKKQYDFMVWDFSKWIYIQSSDIPGFADAYKAKEAATKNQYLWQIVNAETGEVVMQRLRKKSWHSLSKQSKLQVVQFKKSTQVVWNDTTSNFVFRTHYSKREMLFAVLDNVSKHERKGKADLLMFNGRYFAAVKKNGVKVI